MLLLDYASIDKSGEKVQIIPQWSDITDKTLPSKKKNNTTTEHIFLGIPLIRSIFLHSNL